MKLFCGEDLGSELDTYFDRELQGESGSTLPLMMGLFMMALSIYMVCINIYTLNTAKLRLERVGEDFIASLYQEVSYDHYFRDESISSMEVHQRPIPVSCQQLMSNILRDSPRVAKTIKILAFRCESGRLNLSISERVNLPFIPQFLTDFEPIVIAHVGAELRRIKAR